MTDPDLNTIGDALAGNAVASIDLLKSGAVPEPDGKPTYDFSAMDGPSRITIEELTELAVAGKAKIALGAHGQTRVTCHELIALGFFVNLLLVDPEARQTAKPAQPPKMISDV